MDELDPYSDYTGYDPEYQESSDSVYTHSEPAVDVEETKSPGASSVYDPRRLTEIVPSEPTVSSYSPVSRSRSGSIPLAAVSADMRRISIHPLGIVDKPAGVSGTFWSSLDSDRLLLSQAEIDSHAVDSAFARKEHTGEAEEESRTTLTEAPVVRAVVVMRNPLKMNPIRPRCRFSITSRNFAGLYSSLYSLLPSA